MSVLGIDFGNRYIVAAVPRGRGIDIVASDTSSRVIPSCVSYSADRRYFGDAALSQRVSNKLACYFNLPFILDERFDSAAVRRVHSLGAEFALKENPNNGRAITSVFYGAEQRTLTVSNIMSAMVSKVVGFANTMDNVDIKDFVASVPGNWPYEKRASLKAACEAAGLKCLGVVTQHMAVGMAYYMKRIQEFQAMPAAKTGVKVAFVSLGELQSFASVLRINKEGITALTAVYDDTVGAADFDRALFNIVTRKAYENAKLFAPGELDSGKAFVKVMKACSDAKKVLSVNSKAQVHVECIGEKQADLNCIVTIEEFVEEAAKYGLVERVQALIQRGLAGAVESVEELEAVEVIGGASRMVPIRKLVEELFPEGRVTKRLNPDECVAVGLAWIGALRSPRHRIPYTITLNDAIANLASPLMVDIVGAAGGDGASALKEPVSMFKNGDVFPTTRKFNARLAAGDYVLRVYEAPAAGAAPADAADTAGTTAEAAAAPAAQPIVHEEHRFTIAPHDKKQFDGLAPELLEKHKVDLADNLVAVTVKVQCDQDGFFRVTSLKRNDNAVTSSNVSKMVPNPDWRAEDQEVYDQWVKSEAERKRAYDAEAEAAAAAAATGAAGTVEAAPESPEDPQTKQTDAGAPSAPSAPASPAVPAAPAVPTMAPFAPTDAPKVAPAQIEQIEVLKKITPTTLSVSTRAVCSFSDTNTLSDDLRRFDRQCADIDSSTLRFEVAVNGLESLVYNVRDKLNWGAEKEYVTAEEAAGLQPLLDEHGSFVLNVEGPSQIEELETRTAALAAKTEFIAARRSSHESAEMYLRNITSDAEHLAGKFKGVAGADAVLAELDAYRAGVDAKVTGTPKTALFDLAIFNDAGDRIRGFETRLREAEAAQKKAAKASPAPSPAPSERSEVASEAPAEKKEVPTEVPVRSVDSNTLD